MYKVNVKSDTFYFECPFEWLENNFDYFVTIQNFGLTELSNAGSSGAAFRRHFSREEAISARALIEKYFSRELEVTDFPLRDPRSRCLQVRYASNWIITV